MYVTLRERSHLTSAADGGGGLSLADVSKNT